MQRHCGCSGNVAAQKGVTSTHVRTQDAHATHRDDNTSGRPWHVTNIDGAPGSSAYTCPREKTYPERRWLGTSRRPRHSRRHAPCVACVVARSHTHIRKAGFARQDCAPNTISPAATLPNRSIYVMQARRWRKKRNWQHRRYKSFVQNRVGARGVDAASRRRGRRKRMTQNPHKLQRRIFHTV